MIRRRIATILSVGLLGLVTPLIVAVPHAAADPGYVQEKSETFRTKAVSGRVDCTATVWVGQTRTGYIQSTGTLRCPGPHVYAETDNRIKKSPRSVDWYDRDKDVCADYIHSKCNYEFSSTSVRGARGRQYCGELFAYSMINSVPYDGHRVVCITAR